MPRQDFLFYSYVLLLVYNVEIMCKNKIRNFDEKCTAYDLNLKYILRVFLFLHKCMIFKRDFYFHVTKIIMIDYEGFFVWKIREKKQNLRGNFLFCFYFQKKIQSSSCCSISRRVLSRVSIRSTDRVFV